MFFNDAKSPGANGKTNTGASHHSGGDGCRLDGSSSPDLCSQVYSERPAGLVGAYIDAAKESAPRPVDAFANAAGIAAATGIIQRPFIVGKIALNQNGIVLGTTGSGKDLIQTFPNLLASAIRPQVAAIDDLMSGPGELTSPQGLIRSLANSPTRSQLCLIGETVKLMLLMARSNASPNHVGIERHQLQIYSKSGVGQILGESVYSDSQKSIGAIERPCQSFWGEGVIEDFDRAVGQLMNGGLVPRYLIFEYPGKQVALSHTHESFQFDPVLISHSANLAGVALTLNRDGKTAHIEQAEAAARTLADFEAHCRQELNSAGDEAGRQAWNRAHLKALKLAGAVAVGINCHRPTIDNATAIWATNLLHFQTLNVVRKFEAGDVGPEGGNESKQVRELKRVVREYILSEPGKYEKSGCSFEMHRNHHFAHKYLSDRLLKVAAYRDAPGGASKALNRVINHLLFETGELGNVDRQQAGLAYQTRGKVYAVINENRFMRGDG